MSPLKNTDKHFSDYLPPALVKDWRQCFRSRSSVALFLLLLLGGWLIFGCMVADADKSPADYLEGLDDMGNMLYALGTFALCLIIPFRAGSTVAADTQVRSSNFLMLTPLSARRIVWGTWSSTALIVLLAAILSLPLLFARRAMMTAYPHIGTLELSAFDWFGFSLDSLLLGWLVIAGWVMAGFYMFSSVLPRLLRLLLLLFCASVALNLLEADTVGNLFGACGSGCGREGEVSLPQLQPLLLNLFDAALLLVLFMELAARHYAAPAENGSRAVRLLAPLPLLVYVLMALVSYLFDYSFYEPERQFAFASIYLYVALLSDALLPIYSMPAHAYRLWRGLPAWFQKPGFVASTLCLAAAPFLLVAVGTGCGWDEEVTELSLWKSLAGTLNTSYTTMLWLLITDCFCGRTATKRPVIFGVVALVCTLAANCIAMPLDGYPLWETALPFFGVISAVSSMEIPGLQTVCIVNGALFGTLLLLLVFWRGRVKRA